jgi:hypothetical protein
MEKDIDLGKDRAKPSGAPDAGGATTRASIFGGRSLIAVMWRFLARVARDLESTAYRRLRDLEAKRKASRGAESGPEPGAPRRVRDARPSRRTPVPPSTV